MSASGELVRKLFYALGPAAQAELVSSLNTLTALPLAGTATTLGAFGATPIAQPATYTLTYSTGSRTNSAPTSHTITDSTGGTGATTFAAITAPGANATTSLTADMTAVKNALSQIATELNAYKADVLNLKQVLTQLVSDMSAAAGGIGLVG